MKNVLLLLPLLMLVSCIDPSGKIHVSEKLSLVHTTIFNNHKTINVAPGDYDMKLTIKSNDRFKLSISGIDKDIKIKTKKGISIPNNGTAFFTASELGQRYDMQIDMITKVKDSERRVKRERCDYTDYRTVCRTDSNGNTRCHTQPVTVGGWQQVEYYVHTVARNVKMELLKASSNISAAKFSGNDRDSQEIHVWESICR